MDLRFYNMWICHFVKPAFRNYHIIWIYMGYPNIIRGYYHTQKGYYHTMALKPAFGVSFFPMAPAVPGSGAFWSPVRSTKPWTGSSRQELVSVKGRISRKSIDFCHDIIWGVAVCHVFFFQTTFGFGLAEWVVAFFLPNGNFLKYLQVLFWQVWHHIL